MPPHNGLAPHAAASAYAFNMRSAGLQAIHWQ
jgi:hypothetical protein